MSLRQRSLTTNRELDQAAHELGIFPVICYKDQLRHVPQRKPGKSMSVIVNMDDSTSGRNGTHWVGVFIDKRGLPCYFDSFGIDCPQDVYEFMGRQGSVISCAIESKQQIQNINSGHCGQYTLFFLWFMNGGRHPSPVRSILPWLKVDTRERYAEFLNIFDKDPTKNLTILEKSFP